MLSRRRDVRHSVLGVIFVSSVVFGVVPEASAVKLLQLDIAGGYYDPVTATIIGTSDPFKLYAILTPQNNATEAEIAALLGETYYISAALTPQFGPDGGSLGRFVFEGTTVDVTLNMTYGVPPIESDSTAVFDEHDLQQHGIFETYFSQFPFNFDAANKAIKYNTADDPGGLVPSATGGAYFAEFDVDSRLLASGYGLHFDLYNTDVESGGDIDRDDFAAFSHDAECCRRQVPEPASVILLGSGLLGLGLLKRRFLRG